MRVDLRGKEAVFTFPVSGENIQKAKNIPGNAKFVGSSVQFVPNMSNLDYIVNAFPGVVVDPFLKKKYKKQKERESIVAGIEFKFKTEPYAHQREAFNRAKNRHAFAQFMEMGTGKTKVTIDDAGYQFAKARIEVLIIVAPNGVHRNWVGELEIHMCSAIPYKVVCWRKKKKKALLQEVEELLTFRGLKVLTVNYEALLTKDFSSLLEQFVDGCMMVLDESTRIKNFKAKVTKACIKYGKRARIRRILTGTPTTQGPLDVYSQFEFLDPTYLGYKNFYAFRATYAKMKQIQAGARTVQVVDSYVNVDDLKNRMDPHSFRVLKEDCLDLPPKVFIKVPHELSDEQNRMYSQMKDWLITEVEGKEVMSAQIVLTKLLRLRQIIGGFVQTDDGVQVKITPNARLQKLIEILEDTSGKVIIWSVFVPEIRAIREELGGEAVAYYGEVGEQERKEAIDRFQNDPSIRYFIGNPQAAGLGLTLTAASNVVYYSNSYSLENRQQSEDRAHRIGQSANKVTYFDLVAHGTVDEKIIQALKAKKNIADLITGDNIRSWI